MAVTVHFIGSGDAFGSDGRFQACISVRGAGSHVLLDCGATSLVAMKRQGVDPSSVDAILVSHLHGDHFGGIPFLVLDGQFSGRQTPLTLVGPPTLRDRVTRAMEVLYPGSSEVKRKFELRFVELPERTDTALESFSVTAYQVPHGSGAPAYAFRLAYGDKLIAYSGDTAWTDALVDASRDADLFICELYSFDKVIKNHLAYATFQQHRPRLTCRRVVFTHMSPDTLAHRDDIQDETARDGLILTV
jgi:ribonuclease BN (tRNA processing enzyme)